MQTNKIDIIILLIAETIFNNEVTMQTNIGLSRVMDNSVELENNDILSRLRKLEEISYNSVKELDRLSLVLAEIRRIIGVDVKE